MKQKIIIGFYIFVAVVISSAAIFAGVKVYNWYSGIKAVVPSAVFAPAKENKKAAKVTKEKIKAEVPIEVFNKEEIAKQLKISDPDKSNPNIQFTDARTIPPSEQETSVTAKWDKEKGTITIDSRQEPLSFYEFSNKWIVYADLAYTTNKEMEVAGGISWQCLRVLKIKTELYAEARADFTNIQTGDRNNVMGLVGIRFSKPIFQKD
ncbi:MAG: hypothetical protein LLG40_13300 [Deltaproteobacteria bacterium]|nr:hypothetical protein [Deltaproteobacteria bacterium]